MKTLKVWDLSCPPSARFVANHVLFQETIPPTTEFNIKFLDLLRRIFVYDPNKRITAKQALAHPWFKETLQDDGTEALKIRLSREASAAQQAVAGAGINGGIY